MIRVKKLLLSHELFHVDSCFVQSIEQLDRPGLLVYLPDFVPAASSRPLDAADVYEPDYMDPDPLSAADAPEMDEFLALRDSDAEDEDPEMTDLIARARWRYMESEDSADSWNLPCILYAWEMIPSYRPQRCCVTVGQAGVPPAEVAASRSGHVLD